MLEGDILDVLRTKYKTVPYPVDTYTTAASVCVCVAIPFILGVRLVDVPAGVTQE